MSDTVIKIENLSKQYQLGLVGTNTLKGDLQRWWYRMRGKEDPTLQIGVENRLDSKDGEFIWALKDINFEVKQGDVLGIIGKNGAGKSTLLKIISRITAPTTGSIKVKGRIASLLEVGTGFHGELTGRENIFVNGAILGMKKEEIRRKFDEIVDFSGVEKYIDTPVKRYSSGMYVRLAFAVAAHLDPEILIVDEVLAVGDAEFQKKALGKMQDISSGGGRTVLFVSHNMVAIQNLCKNGVLIGNGKILINNDIEKVVDFYLATKGYENNKFNIKESKDEGNHRVLIRNFYILPEIPKAGCTIVFNYEIINPGDAIEVEVAVSLKDKNDTKIMQFFSQHMNQKILLKKDFNLVKIEIENLPLAPGIYPINLWLGNGNLAYHWLKDSFALKVEPGKISGINYAEYRGYPVILNSKWQVS